MSTEMGSVAVRVDVRVGLVVVAHIVVAVIVAADRAVSESDTGCRAVMRLNAVGIDSSAYALYIVVIVVVSGYVIVMYGRVGGAEGCAAGSADSGVLTVSGSTEKSNGVRSNLKLFAALTELVVCLAVVV